jgi:hypothetical protein
MHDGSTSEATSGAARAIADLSHEELGILAREYLLAGHLIDRAGMPFVMEMGLEVMTEVAIQEWMGASPVYTKRMQRLLGFEGDTVEVALKGMQLDIGAPPEFMDFRMGVQDDRHGSFHLDHCGALMDVEPMGDDVVVAMCHHIEDPTFDATGWATNPKLRMRPIHRPPRSPADRTPHCAWTVTIDPEEPDTPTPERALEIGRTVAAGLPLAAVDGPPDDGLADYSGPLDPDLRVAAFSSPVLRALIDEVALQGHLLVLSFASAVTEHADEAKTRDLVAKQFAGVAGVAADRLARAFGLGDAAADVATAFELHPAFHPRTYVDWKVELDGDVVHLELGEGPSRTESFDSWITVLGAGHDRALRAIAMGVDPHWTVEPEGAGRWVARRSDTAATDLDEVTLTKFSTGVAFGFQR